MTADIRTAARREAEQLYPKDMPKQMRTYSLLDFEYGAVWAQSRVTPTREQVAEAIATSGAYGFKWEQVRPMTRDAYLAAADVVLALMAELAEGESK